MNVEASPPPLVPDRRRRLMLFLCLMAAQFMSQLDIHIVSTALPTIVGEFGQWERFGWIGSAYLLSLSAVMPVYGKLGDLFGRKYVMIAAIVLFTVGSAACGLATSMNSLIAARVMQGLGGGGISVSIFSLNADLFEPRERARYQSYASLVLMASSATGPALGGIMSDLFGWRSIFLVNIPIGLFVITALVIRLPYRKPHRRPTIDYLGALLLASTTCSIVLIADSRELFGSFLSRQTAFLVLTGILCAIAWVLVERRAPEPIIPLSLFRNSTFTLLVVIALAGGSLGIGMVNYFTLYMQTTSGLSPTFAGLMFVLLTGGLVCGSLTSGQLMSRTGRYKPFAIASFICMGTAFALIASIPAGTPLWIVGCILILDGFGIGLAQQIPVIGVQNAAPQRDIGAATGSVTLSRMGGASIAISIYGAIIASQLGNIAAAVPDVPDVTHITPKILAALPEATRHAIAGAYANAFTPLFLTACIFAAIGLTAALLLKPIQLPRNRM